MLTCPWITKRTAVPDRIGKRHVGEGRQLIELAAATSRRSLPHATSPRRDVGDLLRMWEGGGQEGRRGGMNV